RRGFFCEKQLGQSISARNKKPRCTRRGSVDRSARNLGTFSEVRSFLRALISKEESMRQVTLFAAAAIVAASTACGYAQSKGTASPGASRGASQFSPGDQMRDRGGPTPGSRGASEFSPGDQMRDRGTTGRSASEFSPGDKMNDTRRKR